MFQSFWHPNPKPQEELYIYLPFTWINCQILLLHFIFAAFSLSLHCCSCLYLNDSCHWNTLPISSPSVPFLPTASFQMILSVVLAFPFLLLNLTWSSSQHLTTWCVWVISFFSSHPPCLASFFFSRLSQFSFCNYFKFSFEQTQSFKRLFKIQEKQDSFFFFWSFLAEGYFNYSWYKFSILNVYLIKLICNTHRVILSCSPSKMCLFQAKKALTENDLTMPFRQVQRKTSKKCGALQWANTVNEKMFLITKCLFLLWPLILLYCMNI